MRGMHLLRLEALATPLGKLRLYSGVDDTLVAVDWLDIRERTHALLDRRFGRGSWRADPREHAPTAAMDAMRRYFAGARAALDGLSIDLQGSPLQDEVWAALRAVPAGRTEAYAQLAARIGRPGSARAIASAVAANPLLLVLPCHRIVGAGGALAGYAAGIERKRWLLEHEGALARLASGASGRALRVEVDPAR